MAMRLSLTILITLLIVEILHNPHNTAQVAPQPN